LSRVGSIPIGKEISKVVAQKIGIKIDESLDIHPESVKDCQAVLASVDVPEEFKALAREARILLEETFDKGVFQFIHNDAHRENIIIKDKKISGIIDFGNSEYGEVAKEFSRYIRDFPNHFTHIVSSYEACSGNKLSYQRLVSYALLSGLIDIAEDYRKGGDDRVKAEEAIEIYKKLLQV
jgi:thiamine kinase-like enzyme